MTVHILVGLPASGKTTFSKAFKNHTAYVVDFDAVVEKMKKLNKSDLSDSNNIEWIVNQYLPINNVDPLICDGLFLVQADVEWVLSLIFKAYSCNIEKIIIDYWNEDRESCLWNDMGRRIMNSERTIKSGPFEKVDIKRLKEKYKFDKIFLEEYKVMRKPVYLVMANKHGIMDSQIESGRYLCSSSWCLGGTSRSWTGETWPISAEEPCDFDELDSLLEYICPSLTFV